MNGAPWFFKGICWNPVGYNGTQPFDVKFAGYVEGDGDMFKSAGVNAVRTYEPIEDWSVLDELWSNSDEGVNLHTWDPIAIEGLQNGTSYTAYLALMIAADAVALGIYAMALVAT